MATTQLNRLDKFLDKHVLKNRFNSNASKESFWSTRDSEDLFNLLSKYSSGNLQQQVYNYKNNTTDIYNCICGNTTKFNNYKLGYAKFCSKSCVQKSPEVRNKQKATMLKLYGVECNLSLNTTQMAKDKHGDDIFKKSNIKAKKTKLKKYNDENYNNNNKNLLTRTLNNNTHKEVAKRQLKINPDPMKQARNAFKDIYGVSNPSQVHEIQELKTKNSIEKYGVPFQAKHITEDHYKLLDDKQYLQDNSVIDIIEETGIGQSYISKQMIKHDINSGLRSQGELSVVNFIKTFYDGEILTNKRKMFGTEIDIYIPEFNFGIEYNGCYWHSDNFKKTHYTKFKMMEERGDYLLQFFDFEWEDKRIRGILESKIKLKMQTNNERIFARKCIIKDVNSKEARKFLDMNHLQGFVKSSIKKGLYYKDELVSIMTFGKSRYADEYELLRFCNKKNTIITGGASKLFKDAGILDIISFSDNFYSNGNLYKQLGFNKVSDSQGFFYLNIKDKTRVNRMSFQKHKLNDIFDNFDSKFTAEQNIKNNGYFKIYDAKQTKWEYSKA